MLGAGNVATHLANALQLAGYHIVQVYSRKESSASTLASKLNTRFTIYLSDIDVQADYYFYCLSDNALEFVIQNFKADSGIHIHTAGTISMEVFNNYKTNYGVFYPLQTFSIQKKVNFDMLPVFIEANNAENLIELDTIAKRISADVIEISSIERMKLHVAAVFACNFTNHLFEISSEILSDTRIPFKVLLPLINETTAKLKVLSPHEAQTGPAVRLDFNVMQKHLDSLSSETEKQFIYQILSDSIIKKHQVKDA